MEINKNPFEYHENVEYVACVGNNGGTDNYDILIGFRKSVEVLIDAVVNTGLKFPKIIGRKFPF